MHLVTPNFPSHLCWVTCASEDMHLQPFLFNSNFWIQDGEGQDIPRGDTTADCRCCSRLHWAEEGHMCWVSLPGLTCPKQPPPKKGPPFFREPQAPKPPERSSYIISENLIASTCPLDFSFLRSPPPEKELPAKFCLLCLKHVELMSVTLRICLYMFRK